MKAQITRRAAKVLCDFGTGYCTLQHLLSGLEPVSFVTSKKYGWRFDIYCVQKTFISTGYDCLGIYIPPKMAMEYDDYAEVILSSGEKPDWIRREMHQLRAEFIQELKNLKQEGENERE